MKKYIKPIIISLLTIALLVFVYWWGGDSETLHGWKADKPKSAMTADEKIAKAEEKHKESPPVEDSAQAPTPTTPIEEPTQPSKELTCTISVRCDTLLNNMEHLDPPKRNIVPSNGIILTQQTAEIKDGDNVFDVLQREMKRNKIHMEHTTTPMYNSVYIEGIANLYEFDCGELSGWMYRVNGIYPGYGCSQYIVKPGDNIEWLYTCDLGVDIGGFNASGNNQ